MSLKKHILIVDDNHINRQYFSMSLKKSGHKTTAVESGFEAILQAKKTIFDMILMDIRMSDMDGYETTSYIRELPHYNQTPILAVSAEPLSQSHQSTFNGFLLKPTSPKQLASAVDEYCIENNKQQIFNHNQALKYAYDDEKILSKLVELFIDDLPKQLSLIDQSLQNNNHQASKEIIHKLKGSCKTCGADLLDQQLDQLTSTILNQDQTAIDLQLELVNSCGHEFITIMKKYLGE